MTNGVNKPKKGLKSLATIISIIFLTLTLLILLVVGLTQKKSDFKEDQDLTAQSSSDATSESSESKPEILENTSKSAWELVLVNLNNPKEEMNPELITLENILIDSRIERNAVDFLAAAKEIDPAVHLISGYRSVEYQAEIFEGYIQQTLAENPGWTEEEAKAQVMRTSQPPGSSEHQTGLAIDLSTVNELNQQDPAVSEKIAEIAPTYGFILRFPTWGTESTGIDYEDWHFRYVGVENAQYMTQNQLTLEDFIGKLTKE